MTVISSNLYHQKLSNDKTELEDNVSLWNLYILCLVHIVELYILARLAIVSYWNYQFCLW